MPTANGCDPMAPERIIQVRLSFAPGARWGTCYQVVNAGSAAIGLMNVRYLISRTPVEGPQFQHVETIAGHGIFENARVLPRFFLVHRIRPARSLAESAAALHAADFDLSREAIVEGAVEDLGPATAAARDTVSVISYAPSRIVLRTASSAPALLVATDAYYPGWRATVDGEASALRIADVAFRGVRVPAGDHTVEMRFAPRILVWSSAISLLALAAAGLAFRAGRTAVEVKAERAAKAAGAAPGKP
jgi:hypothetical protein